ncbi:ABC transporter permease [Nocardioides taihuensis]|uniref:ABC transporter permease n=1 Tax=Nocardioides taihuensis TaxID=1835606 RepID=A0ABW0BR43_9ACTN
MSAGVLAVATYERRRARRLNGTLVAALVFLSVIAVVVLVGPLFLPSPTQQDLTDILAPPSREAPLGTDQLGRDVLSRVLAAIRLDVAIGVAALVVPFVLGSVLGALAAWRRGWIDEVVGVVGDVVQAFPYYLFILVLAFFLGAGVPSIFVAVAAIAWVSYMRIVRAEVQSAMQQDYVQAAVGAGYSERRVLLRHVLPNVFRQPLTYAVTDVVVVIVSTATLSYLGVGVTPPTPELGAMVADGQQFATIRPLLTLAPGFAVVLIGAALALLGNGLARQLDES